MLLALDDKFDDYVIGRYVSPKIPDDLLEELKKISEKVEKSCGRVLFDFPR